MESIELVLSGCRKILMSYSADGIKRPAELVPEVDQPICIVVGAIAKVRPQFTEWFNSSLTIINLFVAKIYYSH